MNRERNWHSLSAAELERSFRTDSARGISDREAHRRLRHGKNTVWEVKTTSVKRYAIRSLFDLATVMLVLAVFACAFFGSADMAIAICILLLLGRGARIGIYIHAERTFEKNAREALPRAKVVRDGTVRIVASDMVAPGDVIILDSGDTVPCDIRLTAADGILVAEENVTGNKGIVSKNSEPVTVGGHGEVPLAVRTNMVYASSVIISGFAIGVAVATGDDTLLCNREGRITLAGEKDVSTVEKLSDWGRVCSLCLIAAALIITVIGIFFKKDGSIAEFFLPSIAMAAAGLGEYIAAVGAYAWAKKLRSEDGCVLSRSSVAEKAANADVMVLRNVGVVRSGITTLHSYYTDSKLTLMGTKGAKAPARLLRLACYCTGASPEGGIIKGNFGIRQRNAGVLSYKLIRALAEENKSDGKVRDEDVYTIIQHMPAGDIDSAGLDNILLARGNDFYFCAMGEVEEILSMSSYHRKGDEKCSLTEEDANKIRAYAEELKKHGVTLAAIGFRDSHYNNLRRISVLHSNLCFEGFIAVADRPAEGVVKALKDFKKAGGATIIFSEKGEEDKAYAEAEGIFKTGDIYLSAKESATVKALSLEKGSLTLIETPPGADGMRERLRFMKFLDEREKTVSYVGYGVEDMWNMRKVDVAFAVPSPSGVIPQGIRTEAHAIADTQGGGFGAVCQLVYRCRCALLNIRGALNYLIVSQVARLVLMLLSAAAGLQMPSAASLVLWGTVMDFAVAIATANAPYQPELVRLRRGKISATPEGKREVLIPTMYGAMCAVLSIAVPFAGKMLLSYGGFNVPITANSLMTCSVLSCIAAMPFVGVEYGGGYGLFSKKSKLSLWYIAPFAIALASYVLILFVPSVRGAFEMEFPGWIMTAFTLVPLAVTVAVMSVVRAVGKNK